jgi:predicted Zn finger-like uncharacterized protein
MSLATRCSACGTVFRVQKDQLKASEGWVRCGRCGTVFSALEGLFDLERERHSGPMPLQSAPPPASRPTVVSAPSAPIVPSTAPAPVEPVASMATVAATAPAAPPQAPPQAPHPAPAPAHGHATAVDDETPTQVQARDEALLDEQGDDAAERAASLATFRALYPSTRDEDDDADEAALSLLEHSGSHTLEESRPADSLHSGHSRPGPLSVPASNLPSFARESGGEARWRRQRPVARRLTIAAAIALPLLLALQVAMHYRHHVAARWPAATEVLRALCAPLECTIEAPRALEALVVDSSGLSRVDGTSLYRLQLAVRNRAAWPVAMPALDLTLTDSRGETISRRVLRATELGSAPGALEAGAEWSTLATLDVGERRVSGYTIDLFYP